MEGNETFDPTCLGTCAEVCEERVSDDDMIVLKDCKNTQACTMLIRGATTTCSTRSIAHSTTPSAS